jgi:hypothetical protein
VHEGHVSSTCQLAPKNGVKTQSSIHPYNPAMVSRLNHRQGLPPICPNIFIRLSLLIAGASREGSGKQKGFLLFIGKLLTLPYCPSANRCGRSSEGEKRFLLSTRKLRKAPRLLGKCAFDYHRIVEEIQIVVHTYLVLHKIDPRCLFWLLSQICVILPRRDNYRVLSSQEETMTFA